MPRKLPEDPVQNKPLQTGLAFCGEYLVPGGSHLVQGDLKGAAIHGALGFAASMLFGFPARLLFSANSLRTALGGRPVVAPKTEAVSTPASEAAREVPKPAIAAVTKPPSPPARRSPSSRKTVVKTRGKAAAPKPAAATTKKRTGGRSRKSTS